MVVIDRWVVVVESNIRVHPISKMNNYQRRLSNRILEFSPRREGGGQNKLTMFPRLNQQNSKQVRLRRDILQLSFRFSIGSDKIFRMIPINKGRIFWL